MAEATRPGIATHFIRYSLGSVLVMVAGFVSFPIMARLLDYTQYGLIGIFDSALLIMAAVFKFGGQHTVLRFYPHRGGEGALANYGANQILIPFLASCVLWAAALVVFGLAPHLRSYAHDATGWVALASLLPTIWVSMVVALMMAQERSELNVLANVSIRWLNVVAVLGIVYFVSRTALGVYTGRLIVEVVVAVVLTAWFMRQGVPSRWRDRDWYAVWAGMRYGVPLMANEIAAILLVSVDRLMLEGLTGSTAMVGVYTVGASLATQLSSMLSAALNLSYTQVSIRQFETEGEEAVLRTKRRILHFLVYAVVAMLVGLIAVGRDAFLWLSGPTKADSALVFVVLGVNFVLVGFFYLCTSGLQLYKRSMTIFMLTLMSAVVNIILNFILVPRYGVMGAVYATFGSYLLLGIGNWLACPRGLFALPARRPVLVSVGFGTICILVAYATNLFGVGSHFGRMVVMGVLMLMLFVVPALVLDRTLRDVVAEQWNRQRARFG
jgi:O-antigen/teichoic acid export membrane protein